MVTAEASRGAFLTGLTVVIVPLCAGLSGSGVKRSTWGAVSGPAGGGLAAARLACMPPALPAFHPGVRSAQWGADTEYMQVWSVSTVGRRWWSR